MRRSISRFPHALAVIFIIFFVILGIDPVSRDVWVAEIIPVVLVFALLIVTYKEFPFSNLSYALMAFWLFWHTIGGQTMANVPYIFNHGADEYKKLGTEKSTGPKVFCLSGMVKRPGNYEAELGKITFRDLIYGEDFGQGMMTEGRKVKAILPSGASGPIVTEAALDVPLDYESVAAAGSILGSASVIVMDDSIDLAWAAGKVMHFFRHESCGKCTPCRAGTFWMEKQYNRILAGKTTLANVQLLQEVANQMIGKCLCPLGEFADESFADGLLDAPHFTRPEIWRERGVPAPLLSGHHAQIERWRRDQALVRTARERPDLIAAARAGGRLDGRDEKFLREIAQGAGGGNPPAVLDPSSAAARTAEKAPRTGRGKMVIGEA